MNKSKTNKVIVWLILLCVLAVAGLGVYAVFRTMTAFQTDEPLIYKNEKNLRELNRPFPEEPEDGWDGGKG